MTLPLTQLAGRVWLFPHDPDPSHVQPCSGVVDLGDRSVLVDAGNGPRRGREVRAAVVAAGLPEVATIVYTHHHWDHVWGACAWDAVDIVGHAAGAPLLAEDATRPWSTAYAEQAVRDNPRLSASFSARALAVPDWSELSIRPPTRTFDDELGLADGLVVRHVGGGHAPDSSIVIDVHSGVALLGDCFYPPPLHLRGPDDGLDEAMIAGLQRLPVTWLVEAHGEPWRLS
jgi:glyoxylase-like metal-dependent hydrolase (beta-lactamase superfamily II)